MLEDSPPHPNIIKTQIRKCSLCGIEDHKANNKINHPDGNPNAKVGIARSSKKSAVANALSCFAKMCSPQNDIPFFVSYIAILGVLLMCDLEPDIYLFPLHDNHVMFHSGLITVVCLFHPSSYSSSE